MISVAGLTKRYGDRLAVDDLTFEVAAGRVTGFVGPNGAGKSTTMRAMVDLVRPDAGEVRYDGVRYHELDRPSRVVGTVLDAACMHPGRTARNHLRAAAALAGIPSRRVGEVLGEVGLEPVASQRAGRFSLGMRQRLALAGALLGEPRILLLDEPSNGLDPDGIRWLRGHLRTFADRGGTVLVSSHLIAELAMFADDVVVVGAGRLLATDSIRAISSRSQHAVVVETPQRDELTRLLTERRLDVDATGDRLVVGGTTREHVSQLALDHRIRIDHIGDLITPLEDILLAMTSAASEYTAHRHQPHPNELHPHRQGDIE